MTDIPWHKEEVTGEVELAAWTTGRGEASLVCLHGITAQHRSFNALARHLDDHYRIVGLDLRGRGDSAKPEAGYGLEAHAADVVRSLDHLGLERAVIAGHSMGAFVGLQAALSHPSRVEALVLLDGGWPRPEAPESVGEEQKAVWEGLERAFRRLDTVFGSPDAYLDYWFPSRGLTMYDLPPDLADYYRYDLKAVDGGYRPKASRSAAEQDTPDISASAPTVEDLRKVACPVALVRPTAGFFPGSEPLISDEARDAMAGALDLRSDTVLAGADHYSMMFGDFADRAAEAIKEFLREVRGAGY